MSRPNKTTPRPRPAIRHARLSGPFAKALLETPSSWSFPAVAGLSSCPVMRADGSIYAANGCDAATQLYIALAPDLVMPDISL
jgi:hypothetical protein